MYLAQPWGRWEGGRGATIKIPILFHGAISCSHYSLKES